MRNVLVADIMTREPIILEPEINLLECAKKMVKQKIGSFPLVRKKKLVGFISQQDILWAMIKKSKEDLKDIKAIDISPKKIATIRPTATVEEASNKMKDLNLQKLPVIQESMLVGIITLKDILAFKPEFYPELEELSRIREESEKLKRLKKTKEKKSEGICEGCGNHHWLYNFNGALVCESCMNS